MESPLEPCLVLLRSCSMAGDDVRRWDGLELVPTDGKLEMLSRCRGWEWDCDGCEAVCAAGGGAGIEPELELERISLLSRRRLSGHRSEDMLYEFFCVLP